MLLGSKNPDLRRRTNVVSKHSSRWKDWIRLDVPKPLCMSVCGDEGLRPVACVWGAGQVLLHCRGR
jgi:hypothetical protein